ncbi:MAG: DUF2207 domain-containing protein [Acidimicrobiales bacterium]
MAGGLGSLLGCQARDRRLAGVAYLPPEAEPDRRGLTGFFEKPDGPVQFRPPDAMTPGLCAACSSTRRPTRSTSATIVDLAVRGHLQIEERPASGTFRRTSDFSIRFLGKQEDLNAYEQLLYGLRARLAGADSVLLSGACARTRHRTGRRPPGDVRGDDVRPLVTSRPDKAGLADRAASYSWWAGRRRWR